MSYFYETPTTTRLSLGTSDARYRLCLPVTHETLAAVARLTLAQQREFVTVAGLMLEVAVESMMAPQAGAETAEEASDAADVAGDLGALRPADGAEVDAEQEGMAADSGAGIN